MFFLPILKRAIRLSKYRSFAQNARGSVLVEFALLAIPFFALVGAMIEMAVLLLGSAILDAAVDTASRKIRTGQAHAANYTLTSYRAEVCSHTYGLFDCSGLRIMVTPISDFGSASLSTNAVDLTDGSWDAAETYSHGASSTIVLAQVFYKWPTYLDFFHFDLASLPDDTRLMSAARLFQNEPF